MVRENGVSNRRWWIRSGRVVVGLGVLTAFLVAFSGQAFMASLPRIEPLFDSVILVSVDGLRPDAIDPAGATHLAALRDTGVQARVARTVYPSSTLPGHTSMLTGVVPAMHGVRTNTLEEAKTIAVPTVFRILDQHGLRSIMISGKPKFSLFDQGGGIAEYFGPTPREPEFFYADRISEVLEDVFTRELPDLLFVHFPDPDAIGHKNGWMSKEQFAAIRGVDRVIGQIAEHMRQRFEKGERILLIVSADHGGSGLGHRNNAEEDLRIPWIAWSPALDRPGSIDRIVRTIDTTPTILEILGVAPPRWTQGRTVEIPGLPLPRVFDAESGDLADVPGNHLGNHLGKPSDKKTSASARK